MRYLSAVLLVIGFAGCDDPMPSPADMSVVDLAVADLFRPDLSADLAKLDLAAGVDGATADLALPDLAMPDLATCTPNAFLRCSSAEALYCNGSGDGVAIVACGAGGCSGPSSCGQCTPNTSSCVSNALSSCDAFGRQSMRSCALGCIAGTGDADAGAFAVAHCASPAWSNGLALDCNALAATLDLNVAAADVTLDPQTVPGKLDGVDQPGTIFSTFTQVGAPDVAVFRLKSLTVAAGRTLRITGGPKAIALIVDGAVQIDGTLDVAGHLDGTGTASQQGAGSVTGTGGNGGSSNNTGGGGGGFGSVGGPGGNKAVPAFGAGGAVFPGADPLLLVPLQGGGRGRHTGTATGGQGGGAIQIIACGTLTVGATGLINASGSGAPKPAVGQWGGGGGAGGGILLESPSVSVAGVLAVTGGGGAGGGYKTVPQEAGSPGSDGATGASCSGTGSSGGAGAPSGGGVGGRGACGTTEAQQGKDDTPPPAPASWQTNCGGGGGGGGGRVRLNATTAPSVTGTLTPVLTGSGTTTSTGTLPLQ